MHMSLDGNQRRGVRRLHEIHVSGTRDVLRHILAGSILSASYCINENGSHVRRMNKIFCCLCITRGFRVFDTLWGLLSVRRCQMFCFRRLDITHGSKSCSPGCSRWIEPIFNESIALLSIAQGCSSTETARSTTVFQETPHKASFGERSLQSPKLHFVAWSLRNSTKTGLHDDTSDLVWVGV